MGGKYEVRWKYNSKCPFWAGIEYTDDLTAAFAMYDKAVNDGFHDVELTMHEWKVCPKDCEYRCKTC